ncbi:MAG TPA: radical SAM protein [Vicinamibacterales bacterium]|nr:radical SAM protein [Vicinamibacterales bacterium]
MTTLPEPVWPPIHENGWMSTKEYRAFNRRRAIRCWLLPYLRSRLHAQQFHPLLAYLFTEWKCNLDCHYCWAHHNQTRGMTEDVARNAIDWLHETGCRVLAIMGGEPLLRPKFIQKVVAYATGRGFFVYLPTNGRLMWPWVIDRIGVAGVSTVNLAVDCLDERPGLPKALNPVRAHFDYLVKMQYKYGYTVFLNINVTRQNLTDVKVLTEIAHDANVATDYHLNEAPMTDQQHFARADDNGTYIRPEDWPAVDDLLDSLAELSQRGYRMVNSRQHFADMKRFMRGEVAPWVCRAGQSSLIIRTDGTLAPCFTYYSVATDWGAIKNPRFDTAQLTTLKKTCTAHCLSTCQHTLGYAYDAGHLARWLGRQARNGFRGVTGSF